MTDADNEIRRDTHNHRLSMQLVLGKITDQLGRPPDFEYHSEEGLERPWRARSPGHDTAYAYMTTREAHAYLLGMCTGLAALGLRLTGEGDG